jgi:hypothetical protein
MDSKTLTTVVVVFLCVLFFPVFIAVAGGLVGILGAVVGGFVGIVGGIFGAFFGLIGAIIGGILSFFGWIFESGFHCAWPFHFSGGRMIAVFLAVLVVVMIIRSRKGR